jgi:hypothetical protein
MGGRDPDPILNAFVKATMRCPEIIAAMALAYHADYESHPSSSRVRHELTEALRFAEELCAAIAEAQASLALAQPSITERSAP